MCKRKECKVCVLTNLKGGVGKTTDTDQTVVTASQLFHKKVLLIDVDMQGNSTLNMQATYGINEFPTSFTKAVMNNNLKDATVKLSDNLDFIAGSEGTHELNEWILDHSKTKKDRYLFLKDMVDEIRDDYDYIFFDVAPSTDNSVDAICMVADYIIPVQEVLKYSMAGTSKLIHNYLMPMIQAFPDEAHFQIAGILPAIFQTRKKRQMENYHDTILRYGRDNVFTTIIKRHERLMTFGEDGITLNDYQDRKMWALFADLFSEMEERIQLIEETGDLKDYTYTPKYFDIEHMKLLPMGKKIKIEGVLGITEGSK